MFICFCKQQITVIVCKNKWRSNYKSKYFIPSHRLQPSYWTTFGRLLTGIRRLLFRRLLLPKRMWAPPATEGGARARSATLRSECQRLFNKKFKEKKEIKNLKKVVNKNSKKFKAKWNLGTNLQWKCSIIVIFDCLELTNFQNISSWYLFI